MKNSICLLSILLFSDLVFSGPKLTSSVDYVRVRPAVTYVKLSDCARYNKIYLNTEYGKAMYSAALTAAVASKQVRVEFVEQDGCDTQESEFIYFEVVTKNSSTF